MLLHAADLVRAGYRQIMQHIVDTDVVVLATSFFQKLGCEELWKAFGTG
jgi:hypothetical protein